MSTEQKWAGYSIFLSQSKDMQLWLNGESIAPRWECVIKHYICPLMDWWAVQGVFLLLIQQPHCRPQLSSSKQKTNTVILLSIDVNAALKCLSKVFIYTKEWQQETLLSGYSMCHTISWPVPKAQCPLKQQMIRFRTGGTQDSQNDSKSIELKYSLVYLNQGKAQWDFTFLR